MRRLRDWLVALDQLFFPSVNSCGICRERPSSTFNVCQECLVSLAISWQRSELHGYVYFSLFPYQGYARSMIHNMKFQSGYELACVFGFLLGIAALEEPELVPIDVLLPIPLHDKRLQQRGFNQVALLADSINKMWRRPVYHCLYRQKDTQPQSGLSSAERKDNMLGAFTMLPGFELKGKQCLIIDDVITSGYTFLSAAQLVERYGGKPMGLFLARTEVMKE